MRVIGTEAAAVVEDRWFGVSSSTGTSSAGGDRGDSRNASSVVETCSSIVCSIGASIATIGDGKSTGSNAASVPVPCNGSSTGPTVGSVVDDAIVPEGCSLSSAKRNQSAQGDILFFEIAIRLEMDKG